MNELQIAVQARIDHVRKTAGDELQRLLTAEGQGNSLQIDIGFNGDRVRLSVGTGDDEQFEIIEFVCSDEQICSAVGRLFTNTAIPSSMIVKTVTTSTLRLVN